MKPKVLFFLSVTFLLLLGSASVGRAQSPPPPVSFAPAVSYTVGSGPYSVAVGDFNGDGKPDLAVANFGSNNVSVLLGNGNGTFQTAVNYGADTAPASVAVGSFRGNGKLDLAVANFENSDVSVLLGIGDGTFQPAVNYPTGSAPFSVAVGDFNGDGKLDLAVLNNGGGTVSVLLGKGDGTFLAQQSYGVCYDPRSLAVGDFKGDGNLDLVATCYDEDTVSVLLGNGDGTFQTAVTYPAGTMPYSVAVGDFNGDGKLDLAVTDWNGESGPGSVSVLLGNGDGSFQSPMNFAVGTYPWSVAVGDFNGDGVPDLAVANDNDNNVSVLLGNGDGSFQAAVNYALASSSAPFSVAVGDFNGDGKPDLAVADNGGGVSVLLNTTVPPITLPLVPTGGTNLYQFNNNVFNYKVTYPALSSSSGTVYLSVWPILISQADLNARLNGQFPGATLVPYLGTGGYGILFRVTCQDSNGNTVTCPTTIGANTFYTSFNYATGQTITNPAFLMAEIAPVGTQTWSNIFTAYSPMRTDPTTSGRGCCSYSDFAAVQGVTGTAPTITITSPQDGAVYSVNQSLYASYSCNPPAGTPPVLACLGNVANGSPADTSSAGSKTFTVNATVSAGPASVKQVSYTVTASHFLGFFSPVSDPNPGNTLGPFAPPVFINTIKAGQAVPVKWQVLNAGGGGIAGLTLYPTGTVAISQNPSNVCSVPSAIDSSISAGVSGNSGLQDLGGGNYQFNWKTSSLYKGCIDLAVNPGDGTLHHAYFLAK